MGRAGESRTLTFLFTDIEGSTRRWVEHGDVMADAVARHDEIVTTAVEERGGQVFATGGDGFAIAFEHPSSAVAAATTIQDRLASEPFDAVDGLAVRMGIHTGTAEIRDGDHFGPEVARAARIGAAGHGGQVLLSAVTAELVDASTRDLGRHGLRDFPDPEPIHQLELGRRIAEFPPLRTLDDERTTLPSPRSAFFGRQDEIDRVRRSLHDNRLVTLTGVGGTGKTRLAVEAAWDELPSRPGGAFFADLTSATDDGQLLAAVVAGTIGRSEAPDLRAQLFAALAPLNALVVIDNCEHLLDESAELVEDLLDACPDLRVIATSREPLDVEGEQIIRIPSLAAADAGEVAGPAVRLFIDRARAADPDLDLADQHHVITDICERLDGIPLAIELAAARTRVLTPDELLARLDDRFSLLTGSRRRRGHQRQKTLEAAVAWSYDLLNDDEQHAFRSLAVLERGFDLAAAAATIGAQESSALDMMDSLVAKSLVVRDAEIGRFSLLETLRQYAEERLVEAGDADATRTRHLAHFRALCHRPEWLVEDQLVMEDIVERVDRERANIVAALEWAEETGDDESLVDIVLGCGTELAYGHLGNTRWLDEAIERADRMGIEPTLRAGLLFDRIGVAVISLDAAAWSRSAKRAREILAGDHPVLVGVLSMHGFLRMADAPEINVRRCREALEMSQRLGLPADSRWVLMTKSQLAVGLLGLRQYDDAIQLAPDPGELDSTLSDGAAAMARPAMLHLVGRSDEGLAVIDSQVFRTALWRVPVAGIHATILAGSGRVDEAIEVLGDAATKPRIEGVALATDNLILGFAAVRAERGEVDRAHELARACAGYRTPGSLALLVELVASLEGWSDDEFIERRRALVLARFEPAWMDRTEPRRTVLLAEEVAAFRPAS